MMDTVLVRNPSHGDCAWKWLMRVLIILAVAMLTVQTFWLTWPYTGITALEATSDGRTFIAGGLYRWTLKYCVSASVPLPIVLDRELELVNHHTRFSLPVVAYSITHRCETIARATILPTDTPSGTYHLVIHTRLSVNPLRDIAQEWQGDDFVVVGLESK